MEQEKKDKYAEYTALMQQVDEGKYDGDGPENVVEPKEPEEVEDGEHS